MQTSRSSFSFAVAAIALGASASASAAPGVYAQEVPPNPLPAQSVVAISGNVAGYDHPGALRVTQHLQAAGGAFTAVGVPICISGPKVGHSYAALVNGKYQMRCYVDGGPTTSSRPILKPTPTQASKAVWVPMARGQALPRLIAPVEYVDQARIPVYACKSSQTVSGRLQDSVGTLLPDGRCRLAPTLSQGARTVDSSMVLLWGGDPAPRHGWISLVAGGHPAGGTLVTWPNQQPYCESAGVPGILRLRADGTVEGCATVAGVNEVRNQQIRVFRNDAASKVGWSFSGQEINTSVGVPCIASGNVVGVLNVQGQSRMCVGRTGSSLTNVSTLRQQGAWPDAG